MRGDRPSVVDRSGFERDGWAVVRGAVDGSLCDAARKSLERRGPQLRHRGERWQDAWRVDRTVHAIATNPAILCALEQLYGRRPIPFQTLGFAVGTEQRLHADAVHFDTVPHGWLCGVWVALEDVTEDQGPLVVVSGSQRDPVTVEQVIERFGRFGMGDYEDLVTARVVGKEIRPICLDRGDAVVWSADLVHGGAPVARPGATRWSQVTHYVFEGCTYVTPMFGDPRADELHLRHPLFDITDGHVVEHVAHSGRARFHHVSAGRSKLIGPECGPLGRIESGLSTLRGALRYGRRRASVAVRAVVGSGRMLGERSGTGSSSMLPRLREESPVDDASDGGNVGR